MRLKTVERVVKPIFLSSRISANLRGRENSRVRGIRKLVDRVERVLARETALRARVFINRDKQDYLEALLLRSSS